MNNDEIILDILEKVHDKVESSRTDIQAIKIEQVRQNLIVTQHEARSTASEGRLSILEKDSQLFRNFVMFATIIGGLIGFAIKIYPILFH